MGKRIAFNDIVDAAYNYREDLMKEQHIETDTIEPVYDRVDLESAFKEGILWFKDNIWHRPEEDPEIGTVILYEYRLIGIDFPCFDTERIIDENDYPRLAKYNYEMFRWAYINDLI